MWTIALSRHAAERAVSGRGRNGSRRRISAKAGGALCIATTAKSVALGRKKNAELRLADARRVFQHGLKYRLQTRRATS